MFDDWWRANRLEVYVSLVFLGLIGAIAAVWWIGKMISKTWKSQ